MHSTFKTNYNININETNIPLTGPLKADHGWDGKHIHMHPHFPPTRSLKADLRLGMETHTYTHTKHFPPTRSLKADRRLGRETHIHTHTHTHIHTCTHTHARTHTHTS